MRNREGRRRLTAEIVEFLLVSLAVAAFTYLFLYYTSGSLAETYLGEAGAELTPAWKQALDTWLGSICLVASGAVFLVLFLFMVGQRLAYLLKIIRGVDILSENRMDGEVPVEGNDELTELAERINRLAASERQLAAQEQRLSEEREAWVRALSHDIRTPLTSVIAATQLLEDGPLPDEGRIRAYIQLVDAKTEQIRELTNRLLEQGKQNLEPVEHIRLFMEQLAAEWEEVLEETFSCRIDLTGLPDFSGMADVSSFRRIFDNLASNGKKYADPEYPVELWIAGEKSEEIRTLTLCQRNRIPGVGGDGQKKTGAESQAVPPISAAPESLGIGLESIRRIAADYSGTVEIRRDESEFEVKITLKIPGCL